MQIKIDNFDGKGPIDYSASVAPEGPITVQRALNVPSRCTTEIVVGVGNLAFPSRHARVTVSADSGLTLFTGFLAIEPVRIYAGETSSGAVYRARLSAVSDEWLLDKQSSGSGAYGITSLGLSAAALIDRLVSRVQPAGASALAVTSGTGVMQTAGTFTPSRVAPWSVNAGDASSSAYASYRAIGNQVVVQPAGVVTHSFSDADGTLSVAELQTGAIRELANDVTLSGAEEPTAYIAESFLGDGTTSVFELSEPAFRETNRVLLNDSFNEALFDLSQWKVVDPGSHLSLTADGLTMSGGNGVDGQTNISSLDAVEMGGSIVAQLAGVTLGAGSDGMLGGMYEGTPLLADCFAGFRVRQNAGATVLVPVLNGAECGTLFTPLTGHKYTLRLRLHCVEAHRAPQRYYCMVDGVVKSFGSPSGVAAPMDAVFELIDEGASSNTPATVLYDTSAAGTTIASSPASCDFVIANSTQLFGSVAAVRVTRPGTAWVVSTLPGGAKQTRLTGIAGEGVDCAVDYGTQTGPHGKITFFSGRTPAAGERITVFYRAQQRSVARIASATSIAGEAIGGTAGLSRWIGKVLQPVARTSVDCESAAQAVLALAVSRTAAIAGSYSVANPADDIWPGDVLAVTSDGVTSSFLVRSVVAKDGGAQPEVRLYELTFANDWAAEWVDGLGLKLNETIAADVGLPQTAELAPGSVLANLQQLAVTSLTSSTIQLDAGIDPPAGGGFEVRRRDSAFGFGVDSTDLVLRSPVRSFSIPRATQGERFYVRMYDASAPPLYSRFSSAVFINAPVS